MATEMAGKEHAGSEVSQALIRYLNCLNDDNKSNRKRALENIRKEIVDRVLSASAAQDLFEELLKPLLKCLADPMEKCRELALQMLSDLMGKVPSPEKGLPYLISTVVHRLGSPAILEPAEELRLALVELMTLTVEVCGKHLAPYLDDMVQILQKTIVDPFPDVKKESCKCAEMFAKSIPEHFHMQAESLIKPLMQTISHQHSKVRVAVIRTTGTVVQYGSGKSVDDVLSHLAQRLFDDAVQVRQAVTDVVGNWLLELRDRYSYFHKLIPLLLSSFNDEMPAVRDSAVSYWKAVGEKWQKENEEDLKDKLDFSGVPPALYPVGVERPSLGCRELVFRNLTKILPAISNDIRDWVVGTRIKASQLLAVLLLHAEDHITQHMELILTTLYSACCDEEMQVISNCVKSAELIGTFVNPEVFVKMILQALQKAACPAHLMVLAAVLKGCSRQALQPYLKVIGDTVSHPDVCQASEKVIFMEQLMDCIRALIEICGEDCRIIILELFKVLITIQSFQSTQELHSKVLETMNSLAKVQNLDSYLDLYRLHMVQLLEWTSAAHQHWTSYSVERVQFETVIIYSGPVIGEVLPIFIPILKESLQPDQDPEVRLKLFTVLSKLLLNADETVNSQGQFIGYAEILIKDILVPNLHWHVGRVTAAIRMTAISCLWALLHSQLLSAEQALNVHEPLIPLVIATLDEDSKITRLTACRVIRAVLQFCGQYFDPDKLNKIYPELLKRLDDASDEVRIAATKALISWVKSVQGTYDRTTYRSHIEFLYRTLLVHLDDPERSIQNAVLDVLREGSVIFPVLLLREIDAVKHKHRSTFYCDQLLQHIQSSEAIAKGGSASIAITCS
ncbi:dynein axonemal assembly factor 5 [Protopterus annectens]|uniref:dynein axonemal assembly factor 5 n=1 Tax=Protopterus annectens TaxID=7888 RepID=UPI001CFBD91B|nr:dynein axonemal assembly factor 5 [Protopterus annectens]